MAVATRLFCTIITGSFKAAMLECRYSTKRKRRSGGEPSM